MKKEKTTIYVVDFVNKKLVLREEINNKSQSKKEQEKIEKVHSAVSCLEADLKIINAAA